MALIKKAGSRQPSDKVKAQLSRVIDADAINGLFRGT